MKCCTTQYFSDRVVLATNPAAAIGCHYTHGPHLENRKHSDNAVPLNLAPCCPKHYSHIWCPPLATIRCAVHACSSLLSVRRKAEKAGSNNGIFIEFYAQSQKVVCRNFCSNCTAPPIAHHSIELYLYLSGRPVTCDLWPHRSTAPMPCD